MVEARGLTQADVILAPGVRVDEHTTTIDGAPVFYRSAGEDIAALYIHDAITSSSDLVPFLQRGGGVAPDLIGFGRSGKGGHLDYSPRGLVDFLERFLDAIGLERVSVVGHGWGGALGLLLAQARPALLERLVLIDALPLFDDFRWHGPARIWRRRLLGELLMGSTPRWLLTRELRRGTTKPGALSPERLDAIWEEFDQGTQRAILRLHRTADAARMAEPPEVPALVVWGGADPWFPARFADAYAARLGDARVERVGAAGHWPWLDQPHVVDLVVDFLSRP